VIAAGRARRPGAAATVEPPRDPSGCPFCEGRERATPPETFAIGRPGRPADAPGWRVRVVSNKFPAFGPWPPDNRREGLFARRPAIGRQEVVIHSPRHVTSLADLGSRELEDVTSAWRERAQAAREVGFPHLQAILNEGRAAGASLDHSHSQLVWLTDEPPAVELERHENAAAGGCLLCRLLAEETSARIRVVTERDGLVLLAAYAGRVPYEMLIAPRRCEKGAFASELLESALVLAAEAVRRLHAAEGRIALNMWLRAEGHWRLDIVPRMTIFAGLELGVGYFVNTMAPESAAGVLREA
jgi:UDPglucose--hexose-1-phosphate uridylyltransferase